MICPSRFTALLVLHTKARQITAAPPIPIPPKVRNGATPALARPVGRGTARPGGRLVWRKGGAGALVQRALCCASGALAAGTLRRSARVPASQPHLRALAAVGRACHARAKGAPFTCCSGCALSLPLGQKARADRFASLLRWRCDCRNSREPNTSPCRAGTKGRCTSVTQSHRYSRAAWAARSAPKCGAQQRGMCAVRAICAATKVKVLRCASPLPLRTPAIFSLALAVSPSRFLVLFLLHQHAEQGGVPIACTSCRPARPPSPLPRRGACT